MTALCACLMPGTAMVRSTRSKSWPGPLPKKPCARQVDDDAIFKLLPADTSARVTGHDTGPGKLPSVTVGREPLIPGTLVAPDMG